MRHVQDFNSHAPCGARPARSAIAARRVTFQLTRPMRGATSTILTESRMTTISTHTPHAGRDDHFAWIPRAMFIFQLTRPMRGATANVNTFPDHAKISTHTPHAGRDGHVGLYVGGGLHFNSHAPCGARRSFHDFLRSCEKFQLTRPMRGATVCPGDPAQGWIHFNSHAPCGARRTHPRVCALDAFISTHTPHAGRDMRGATAQNGASGFQLTRPMRGATPARPLVRRHRRHFNSHAPCGARPRRCRASASRAVISTHTPHAGRDGITVDIWSVGGDFNSHAPCGARRCRRDLTDKTQKISTHTPHAGRDRCG